MAERTVAPRRNASPCPTTLDDATAAAIANPGMSSWAAYTERAKLQAGETVLVNGATGAAGRLAVQIARHLGAKKVIATGRNVDGPEVARRARRRRDDSACRATRRHWRTAFKAQFAEGVDVVIDYLWGRSAERLLIAGAKAGHGRRADPLRPGRVFERSRHHAA